MKIKQASANDFDELKKFYTRMNEVINVRNNHFNPDNAVFPSDDMIKYAISRKWQFIGIEDERIVAGCIVTDECEEAYLQVKWNISSKKDEVWILHALRVAPEYEGRGFAKQMLAYVIELAPKYRRKAIHLDVLEGYWVEHLYKLFGFEYVDTVDILYDDIGFVQRFKMFEKEIKGD